MGVASASLPAADELAAVCWLELAAAEPELEAGWLEPAASPPLPQAAKPTVMAEASIKAMTLLKLFLFILILLVFREISGSRFKQPESIPLLCSKDKFMKTGNIL